MADPVTTDVIAVLRADTMTQVFAAARPLQANVYEVARLMDHPLEDGSSIVDHLVVLPVEIELPVVVTGSDDLTTVYAEIRELFRVGEILTVQTRAGTYGNMVLQAVPHDEKSDAVDALTITLQLKEAIFVKAQYGGAVAPISPPQVAPPRRAQARTSTVRRGGQQTTRAPAPTQERGSVLYRLFGKPR